MAQRRSHGIAGGKELQFIGYIARLELSLIDFLDSSERAWSFFPSFPANFRPQIETFVQLEKCGKAAKGSPV
ncbi:MAG: hypothetical protein AB7F32_01635 [Victivallaceae bacterium]